MQQGARDHQPALHSAREMIDLRVGAIAHPDEVKQFVGALRGLRLRNTEVARVNDQIPPDV